MELVQVVNEDGSLTGQVVEKDYAHDHGLIHAEVAAFVINDKGQILLQKRASSKRHNPDKWALSGGHVGAEEGLDEAILRELREELGVQFCKNDLHKFSAYQELVMAPDNPHVTYFYYVRCDKPEAEFVIQREELSEVKWFDIDRVIKMINDHDDTIVLTERRLHLLRELQGI